MALTYGPNLGLLISGNQGESHYSALMAFLRGTDFFGMPRVLGYQTNTPPTGDDGNAYIIGPSPTGAWAGQAGKIARYNGGASAWEFLAPKEGWFVHNANVATRTIYRYTNGGWELFYGEGTFVPTLAGSTTAGTQTYGTQTGSYVRFGRQVSFQVQCVLTAKGSPAGNLIMAGLPFVSPSSPANQLVDVFGENISNASYLSAMVVASTSTVALYNNLPSGSINPVPVTDLQATSGLRLSGTYFL